MQIVVTGADGFLGRNLRQRLRELGYEDVTAITRRTSAEQFASALATADFVYHLAGVNRPTDQSEFVSGNEGLTERLCAALRGRPTPVVYASSTQAALDNPYGRSKRAAEELLLRRSHEYGSPVHLFRLTNVFGKWSRPYYNSAVATFCHSMARGLPITVHDPTAALRLIYVDDVLEAFLRSLRSTDEGGYGEVYPVYDTTVGEVVEMLRGFVDSRTSLITPRVGTGFVRALYATYTSYLPPEAFSYQVRRHGDLRGVFVEVLKTPDCGQFSYFTTRPGVTRGDHYHHTKTEKFLVVSGTAQFSFRQIQTGETHQVVIRGGEARLVETAPGWAHSITNVGDDDLVVLLWANEIFNPLRPDTVAMKVIS